MALFDQLFTATFNGVPFLVDSSDMTYGRKTKGFEYPNKKYRYREDLGENLPQDLYPSIDEDIFELFEEEFLPYPEYGFHTIKSIEICPLVKKEKLL